MFFTTMLLAVLGDIDQRWRNALCVAVSAALLCATTLWLAVPWLMVGHAGGVWVVIWLIPTALCVSTIAWIAHRPPTYG